MKTQFRSWNLLRSAVISACLIWLAGCSQSSGPNTSSSAAATSVTKELTDEVVDAACGECKFGMKGKSCDLAIRVDGKEYFVDGVKMDDHGDAHAPDGMCNVSRRAKVSGTIKNGRFLASSFELLPMEEKSKAEQTN